MTISDAVRDASSAEAGEIDACAAVSAAVSFRPPPTADVKDSFPSQKHYSPYEAKRFGIKMKKEIPMINVERAYTSPIWYTSMTLPH